jgi:hypothetical protein
MVAGLAGTAGLLLNVNCGGGGGGATGGSTGSGGTSTGGKGGSNSSGGNNGTGGNNATGGKGGSGTGGNGSGGNGSGGNGSGGNGSGGSVSTGGNGSGGSGAGGTAGSGAGGTAGAGNTDGGTAQATVSYLFASDLNGFALDGNASAGNLVNLDGGVKPTLMFDNGVGHPDNGSAKIDVTFTDYSQYVLANQNIAPLIDATGKTISVWVMLDAVDGGSTFTGYAQLQINSTNSFHYAGTGGAGLTPGVWKQLTLDLSQQASPFDASQLIQIGVKFATNSKGDSGAFPGPEHLTFHIDTVTDGGNPPAPTPPYAAFDHSIQGFTASANTHPDGGAVPTVTFDSTEGSPNAGSIDVTLPFSDYGQSYVIQTNVKPTANLSGKTIHAKVRLDGADGGTVTIPASYIQLFAQSTGYNYGGSAGTGLTAGTWTDLTLNVSTPGGTVKTGYDPTQIIQFGIQIGTGSKPDGGTFGAEIMPKLHVDSINVQ